MRYSSTSESTEIRKGLILLFFSCLNPVFLPSIIEASPHHSNSFHWKDNLQHSAPGRAEWDANNTGVMAATELFAALFSESQSSMREEMLVGTTLQH